VNRRLWSLVLALASAAAQQTQKDIRFEQFNIRRGPMDAGSEPVMAGMIGADGHLGLLNVTGKPFSATEMRHTIQMLANGAKIETSDSDQLYRDDQGRIRIQQTIDGKTITVIMDPAAHFVAILDPATRTAHKNLIPAEMVKGSVSVAKGQVRILMGTDSGRSMHGGPGYQMAIEELGENLVNGVMAKGTREILEVPAGAIGNDRGLKVIDERWFSADLQVLVKSLNSDPRFGETTYQLTNISRGMQDPTLFQIPPDYTVSDRPPLPGK
jgi:hypothetical protein